MIPEFHYVDDIADAPCQVEAINEENDARHERASSSPDISRWRYRTWEVVEDFAARMPHENFR